MRRTHPRHPLNQLNATGLAIYCAVFVGLFIGGGLALFNVSDRIVSGGMVFLYSLFVYMVVTYAVQPLLARRFPRLSLRESVDREVDKVKQYIKQ